MMSYTDSVMKTSTPTKVSLWNQLYFVLASLLGLICLVIGVSTAINTVLITSLLKVKTVPTMPPNPVEIPDPKLGTREATLTPEQQQALESWRMEYQQWQKTQASFDYEAEQRKRDLAWSIALIITGAPVFALHAPVVFRRGSKE